MIVIVEGLDCIGKTTICQKISKQYNYHYIKESYTDDNSIKQNRIINMLIKLFDNQNYIYDRTTLIDDFVYDFLNKKPSDLYKYKQIIISILNKCKIIHLQLDQQIQKQRLQQRGDQYIKDNDIKIIQKQYQQFYNKLDNIKYVKLTTNLDEDIQKIMEVINEN